MATEAGAPILGGPSLKAALDLDWDDPAERVRALASVLDAFGAVERYLDGSEEAAWPRSLWRARYASRT